MNDEDIYDNFVGVFPLNHMNKFIDTAAMLSEKKGKCPFVIANTDSSEKGYAYLLGCIDFELVKISHKTEQEVEIIHSVVKLLLINIF